MIPPGVIQVRADVCHDCFTPCERRTDAAFHADPCAECPLPRRRWPQWGCVGGDYVPPAGDRLAAEIERRVLSPMETVAPEVARAVRRCGGCAQARHAMGSDQPHPDVGTPII